MDQATRQTKLKAAADLVRTAGGHAQKSEWAEAEAFLVEAHGVWSELPEDEDKSRLSIGAAIKEGRGQMALQKNDLEAARALLAEAFELRSREKAAGGTPNVLQMAATCLNLSTLSHKLNDNVTALDFNTRAQETLAPETQPAPRIFLASTYQARATLLNLLGREADALAAYDAGAVIAGALAAEGVAEGKQLRTEMLVNGARGHAKAGRVSDAAQMVEEAAELAWDRFEQSRHQDKDALSHFVAAVMNLVGFAEALGAYARAEDALFKVLRLIGPDPRIVERGKSFYGALLALDDTQLEQGNLPRDEVEESYQKLLQIAAQRAPEPARA